MMIKGVYSHLAPFLWSVFIPSFVFLQLHAANIAFILTTSGYSHRVPLWPLATALADRGHNVSFISGFDGGEEMTSPKVQDIIVPEGKTAMNWLLSYFDIKFRVVGFQPRTLLVAEAVNYFSCQALLRSPTFHNHWLEKVDRVDLLFADLGSECVFGIAKKVGAKVAVFQTLPLMPKTFESYGFSPETHTIPTIDDTVGAWAPPLSFFSRVLGALVPLVWRGLQVLTFNCMFRPLFKETLNLTEAQLPDLYEMEKDVALHMVNSGYLEEYPRSLPPFVIPIPGTHIRETENETLSKELVDFLKDAQEGFVYISFGTIATAPSLPPFILNAFFKAMEEFEQELKFIWRWEGETPKSYPKNLLLTPWVNQQKLLSHSKIKAFVTQSGRPSNQESFYHAVPTIAIPILGDQDFNAGRTGHLGTSIVLEIGSITKDQLTHAFNQSLKDEEWIKRVKSRAALARDVIKPPIDVGVWWTEFVLRHSTEELNLMKPLALDLYWFQRREFDVWIFILVGMTIYFLILYKGFKWLYRKLVRRNRSVVDKSKKKL